MDYDYIYSFMTEYRKQYHSANKITGMIFRSIYADNQCNLVFDDKSLH